MMKENEIMKSYDYEAVAYESEVYCIDCLPGGVDMQHGDVAPIFACSEWDCYPVCTVCGMEHDYVILLREQNDDKCSVCDIKIENLDDIYKDYYNRKEVILCYECYINGTCGCCDEYVGSNDLTYLGGEYNFDNEYMNMAAEQMLDDGYSDVCEGCLDCQAEQIEQDEHDDLVWQSMTTGKPDMFDDKMRWFWGAE